MRNCIRIPRFLVPRMCEDEWVAPACDCSPEWWEVSAKGEGLSARDCILPDFLRGEGEEERLKKIRDAMYAVLERGDLGRIERGFLLIERHTARGVRKGILAAVDIEAFSPEGAIRPTTQTLPSLVGSRAKERAGAIIEFPHTVLCYKDKRDKIMRALENEELELLYEIAAPAGKLSASFIPEFIASEVIRDLLHYGDPCFGVLDGNHTLAAAKMHWESVKAGISAHEARNHPARFTAAEFVNLCDPVLTVRECGSGEAVRKEELLALWKAGRTLPAKSVRLGSEQDARCSLEGREISYD